MNLHLNLHPVRLYRFIDNLPLRTALVLALLAGLAVPVGLAALVHFSEQRHAWLARQRDDHARITEVLALGMQTPLWEIRPEAGRALIDALMLDKRITVIEVSSPLVPAFLSARIPQHRGGVEHSMERPVMRGDETIGQVRVVMDTGLLNSRLTGQWLEMVTNSLLQLLAAMVIILVLLNYKVLGPVQRLVAQSRLLASGVLDQPLTWVRGDELGALGRSFEETRRALNTLMTDLDRRNRELETREVELARQAQVQQAILDNMTDGITLVDADLHLVAWNRRFEELLELPGDLLHHGIPILEVTRRHLDRLGYDSRDRDEVLAPLKDSFRPGQASTTRTRRGGRRIEIRRSPVPDGGFVSTYTDITAQVEAQRRADESRQLLEAVMDSVPALIHVKDRQLRYRMVNRRCLEHWGLAYETFLGHTSAELFPGPIHQVVEREDRLVLETGQPRPFYEIQYDNGHGSHTLWSTKVPLLDARGEVAHIVTVDIDITERKQAEKERQRWLRLFHDAIESLPNGFAIYDADERLVICNTAFAALYEVSPAELVGITAQEMRRRSQKLILSIDGESPGAADPAVRARRRQGGRALELRLRDGRWLLGSYHPTAEGGVVYVRTDITHLKQMEQELRDSERRFRSIAEAHPVPVIISALEQERTLYASPGLADLLRAPVAAILAIPPEQLFDDPEDRIRIRQGLLHQGRVDSYECILRRVDGSTFTAAITARRLDYLGTDAAVGGIIDLTDRKRAEAEISRQREALHQSEKLTALGSLLAGVAHELNNPLSVVVGRAIMLEETASPEIRARVEKIRQAAERCARIVKIFLAIARQQPPQRMWVQINQLLQSAVALVDYGLHSIGAQLELDLAEHLPPVSLDPDQFTQVFSNLAVNARQALEEVAEPRRLTISTRHHPDRGTISIRFTDNGPGVPRAIRSRIFEPFYTSKAEGMGTGVGLSFSHGVISSHGGSIHLEDTPGGGASFVIYLPVTLGQPDHPPADPVTQALPCPRHILLVDDEPGIIELLEEILTAAGHRVDCTSSGNQALARIAANRYDLILSDLKMPDLDGPGLFERLQQDHPQLAQRMVFITGDILSPDTGQFLARSGRPLIEKPFVPEEILGMVRRELGESRPQDGPGVSNAGNN